MSQMHHLADQIEPKRISANASKYFSHQKHRTLMDSYTRKRAAEQSSERLSDLRFWVSRRRRRQAERQLRVKLEAQRGGVIIKF